VRRFNGICIITRDVRRLREFYHAVLQIDAQGDDAFVTFSTPGAALSFFSVQGMESMAPGSMTGAGTGGYTLEFEVVNVDEEYARLTALGVVVVKPPTTQPWGRRSVWFRDPDGNIVNFYTNVAVE
jgi:catechol 2,3-dioxygenase-like lactoylglutathione lyase family enzyme